MNLSNPFNTMAPDRAMTKEEVARAIRQDIAAELDAVTLYEAHIQNTDDEHVQAVLQHIVDEEKTHAAELNALLEYLDNDQKMLNIKGYAHTEALIAGEEVED